MRTKSNVCSALSHLTVILWMPIILVFYKFASRILICGLKPPDRIEGCENLDLLKWLILLASILWISPIISILFASFMDGNGRWAKRRGLPRFMGHQRGVDALKDLLRCCKDWGVGALTVYAFSTENWGRPSEEVEFLMTLFERVLRRELREMIEENVRIRFVGNLAGLPRSLQEEIARSMEDTKDNAAVQFTVATNYGGRQEIIQA